MDALCREIRSLFDPFLDGDLGREERVRVKNHLKACSACRSELAREREVETMLTSFPELACSEEVIRKIEATTLDREEKEPLTRSMRSVVESFHWRTVSVGVAVAVTVFLLVVRPFGERDEPMQVQYTEEEVLKVREQAKWSLAYVAKKMNKTERDVLQEVLLKDLPKTVRKSIQKTVPLFKGG